MLTAARPLQSINPATGAVIEEFTPTAPAEVDTILAAVAAAQQRGRAASFAQRRAWMRGVAGQLRRHAERFAASMTAEMGKPVTDARAEIEKCAVTCEYYADHAERFLADEPAPSDSPHSFVAYEPLGIVLAVMPWNYPFWQVVRFAAPALMAGNAAVLKHASCVSRCALQLEEVFLAGGFPQDTFRTLLVPAAGVAQIIADPRVRAVTLTGSDVTGSQVAAVAGQHLKKTVLELGGSDAFIVLADADLEAAVRVGVRARFQNAGQSCIAAKRFLLVESVADEFEARFAAAARELIVGDPTDPETQMGPLARADLRDDLHQQVTASVAQGARVLAGGHPLDGPGSFYAPTVLAGVTPQMPAFREETFGPVAALTRVPDAAAAVALANDSAFGLGGNLWTADLEQGVALARQMDTGGVFINGMTHSDARIPFGGVKRSGYGR
ncbi:MAG TPA: NAD-dependent succinate-semialdehyde dehydrogenase, partial [Candidatus Dormibacteraeota bacterium]|nr:NAD-dependent succinate-semialdehyde dehydrogenase [Candidatus Dormibacteraeota bacterium]